MLLRNFLFLFICLSVGAALSPDKTSWAGGAGHGDDRLERARALVAGSAYVERDIPSPLFTLKAWIKNGNTGLPLRVYIEGDGYAWKSRKQPSIDPTPKNPIALKLALSDPYPNVAYLARPCQYTQPSSDSNCEESVWTSGRFSSRIVQCMNDAIDFIKKQSGGRDIELIGYSGGAAVAVLLLELRSDVMNLRSVAGGLDPDAISSHHHLNSFAGDISPVEVLKKRPDLRQIHFVGSDDKVIPSSVARAALSEVIANGDCASEIEVGGATHSNGWSERWPELIKTDFCSQK